MARTAKIAPGDPAPPATLVIFGGAGDLSRRLLTPALVNLTRDGLIGDDLDILIVSRGPDEGIQDQLAEHLDLADKATKAAWTVRRKGVAYFQGEFDDPATYNGLADRLKDAGNIAFYLATAASFFGPICGHLAKVGLLRETDGFRRVVVEKPFGHDLKTARALNTTLLGVMEESQIFRIDHFLGKETVQNIMVTRFGNAFLEAVWNNRYIDHVQITAAETVDVGTRGAFYDATGALRDMVPNHLFQLLAMVGMEPPNSFGAEAIRNEKAKLLDAVRIPTAGEAKRDAVRGRYTGGTIAGKKVTPYLKAEDVTKDSETETYAAIKLMIDSWRWAGVPFYLRTGKRLNKRSTEIAIRFKRAPYALFRETPVEELDADWLILRIQPEEGIRLRFNAKRPGPAMALESVAMNFQYKDYFQQAPAVGYETLIYDCLIGDATLFQRADQVEAAWQLVEPVLDGWAATAPRHFPSYAAGSEGPSAANDLLARDGRSWRRIN